MKERKLMQKFNSVKETLEYVKTNEIEFISFYITDIDGRLRNVTIPAENFSEEMMKQGIGFDASNLGFAHVASSDMILRPDLTFAFKDPVDDNSKTLYFFSHVFDVNKGKSFNQDLSSETLGILFPEQV